jgi:hypothetical protein
MPVEGEVQFDINGVAEVQTEELYDILVSLANFQPVAPTQEELDAIEAEAARIAEEARVAEEKAEEARIADEAAVAKKAEEDKARAEALEAAKKAREEKKAKA